MEIYTAQIVEVDKRDLPNPIDITIQSAITDIGKFFAPTWRMVKRWKMPDMYYAQHEYIDDYKSLIYYRVVHNRVNILKQIEENYKNITFLCYCQEHQFCHRNLARNIIKEYCDYKKINFKNGGFIRNE